MWWGPSARSGRGPSLGLVPEKQVVTDAIEEVGIEASRERFGQSFIQFEIEDSEA